MMDKNKINIVNRKAKFSYEFIEKMVVGMVLVGTEIKSIREGLVNIAEAYCFFNGHDIMVKGLHIKEYSHASHFNHDPVRDRKLLSKKSEALKWKKKTQEKGLTVVPIRLFISDRGYAKMELALARGKKVFDKREDLKKKDTKREIERSRLE